MTANWLAALLVGMQNPLFLADGPEKAGLWTPSNAVISYDAGQKGLRVVYQPSEWPSIHLRPATPLDFSGSGMLAVRVTNPNPSPITLGIRCDDDAKGDGYNHSRQGMVSIPAKTTATLSLAAGIDPKSFGMNGIPRPTGLLSVPSMGAPGWNPKNVVALQLFMHKPAQPTAVLVHELRLVPAPSMAGIVDKFGQYTRESWPGKLTSESEFAARLKAEEKELASLPALPNRTKYGGWLNGPKLKATGFFRVEKREGIWWLVDPDGRLFFSNGVDCVGLYGETFTAHREAMFTWLPAESDPLSASAGYATTDHGGRRKEGKTFNFYTANLQRKYGAGWKEPWKAMALRRLPSWGFNTIANWSDAMFHNNGRVPYVFTTGIWGSHKRLASGNDYWGLMHDPFDPEFRISARNAVAGAAAVKNDPFCLGTFVDNELSWAGQGPDGGRYGLAIGALGLGPESPAKLALAGQLKSKYTSIDKLNAAWKTAFSSWDAFIPSYKESLAFTEDQKTDLAAFVSLLSETYHRIVNEELKKVDPNHLYLGCRFAWHGRDSVLAAAKHTDVISFNIYQAAPDRKEWDWLNTLGRPVIIGEFHFGATDRGMFHSGLVDAGSQAGRAKMYERYVAAVASHPAFVGCHWFQYFDQPLTGRTLDGENYQIGMVDVTDTPYPEAVKAAREVHRRVYELRRKAK